MAISQTLMQSTLCQTMKSQADLLTTKLEMYANILFGKVDAAINYVNSLNWSPKSIVDQAAHDLLAGGNKYIPDLNDADQIADMINRCNFLSNSALASPTALFSSAQNQFLAGFNSALSTLTNDLPEFSGAKLMQAIEQYIYYDTDFKDEIQALKGLLGCLQALCGTDISSYLTRLNNILRRGCLGTNGDFDQNKFYDAAGISGTAYKIDNLSNAYTTAKAALKNMTDALNSIGRTIKASYWQDSKDKWPPDITFLKKFGKKTASIITPPPPKPPG